MRSTTSFGCRQCDDGPAASSRPILSVPKPRMQTVLSHSLLFVLAFIVRAEDSVAGRLEEIYRQYLSQRKEPAESRIKRLIGLDQDLRILVDKPWTIRFIEYRCCRTERARTREQARQEYAMLLRRGWHRW